MTKDELTGIRMRYALDYDVEHSDGERVDTFRLAITDVGRLLRHLEQAEPKGNEHLLSAIRAIVEQSHDRDSDALAMGEISDLLKAATVKPVGAIEDLPFIPIKPEVLQAFAKQMLDWGTVWVKYSPGGQAEVIPRDQVMQWPATENRT